MTAARLKRARAALSRQRAHLTSAAWYLLALVLPLAVFGLALAALLASTTAKTKLEPFYCSHVASPTTAKCPPEPGTKVIATYPGGLVATLTWQDGQWWQHLPGGKVIEAPMPHDWRLP